MLSQAVQSLRSVSGSYCGRSATNVGGTFEQPGKSLLSALDSGFIQLTPVDLWSAQFRTIVAAGEA
jgi:hypothetical protein